MSITVRRQPGRSTSWRRSTSRPVSSRLMSSSSVIRRVTRSASWLTCSSIICFWSSLQPVPAVEQQAGVALHRRQRRAQLVADRRHDLHARCRVGPAGRVAQAQDHPIDGCRPGRAGRCRSPPPPRPRRRAGAAGPSVRKGLGRPAAGTSGATRRRTGAGRGSRGSSSTARPAEQLGGVTGQPEPASLAAVMRGRRRGSSTRVGQLVDRIGRRPDESRRSLGPCLEAGRLRRWRAASKHSTAAAMPTLSDSTPAGHGDGAARRRGAGRSRSGRPWASLPMTMATGLGRGRRRCRSRRGGLGAPVAGPSGPPRRAPPSHRPRSPPARETGRRPTPARPSGCRRQPTRRSTLPPTLQLPRRCGGWCPGCRGRGVHAHDHEVGGPSSRSSRRTSTVAATASDGWGVTVSATRARTPGCEVVHPAPAGAQARRHGVGRRRPRRRRRGRRRRSVTPAAAGLRDQLAPLHHEAALGLPGAAAPTSAPQALHLLVLTVGQPGQEAPSLTQAVSGCARRGSARASRATSTSAAKAASSRTARSASTLRSTSTPAARSPAMKRL